MMQTFYNTPFSTIRADNAVISGSHCTITGDGNIISGSFSTVAGNRNVISGSHSSVRGNGNVVSGSFCSAIGENNVVSGSHSTPHQLNEDNCKFDVNSVGTNHMKGISNIKISNTMLFDDRGMHNIGPVNDEINNPMTMIIDNNGVQFLGHQWSSSSSSSTSSVAPSSLPVSEIKDPETTIFTMKSAKDETTDKEDQQCIICVTNRRNAIAYPCGHVYCCASCARMVIAKAESKYATCAQCRENIKEFRSFFM
jgi:hypothetical protein